MSAKYQIAIHEHDPFLKTKMEIRTYDVDSNSPREYFIGFITAWNIQFMPTFQRTIIQFKLCCITKDGVRQVEEYTYRCNKVVGDTGEKRIVEFLGHDIDY